MKSIVVFTENEEKILTRIMEILPDRGNDEALMTIQNNVDALVDLARSISLYPSILGKQQLGRASRSVETLVENLCVKDVMDLKLHTPTKAILGQGFAVAKINFFFMLFYLSRDMNELNELKKPIMDIISNNVFAVMAEEVFLAIISDNEMAQHIRTNAAYLLANLWERRIDFGVREFAPILNNIWFARNSFRPAFGTMLGISELFMMSDRSDPLWLDFLQRDELSQDELISIQEFLMGISYEEMNELSAVMEKQGKTSMGAGEINEILGEEKSYPEYTADDPRDLYRSFRHRKKNAALRARMTLPGPKKTIEEYIMGYLLSRPE